MYKLSDLEREEIIWELARLAEVGTPSVRRYWWSMLKNMIDGRSAAQVEKMERAADLSRRTVAA
jgi:hypothetical protein